MKNKSYSTLLTLFFVSCGLFKSAEDYFDEAKKMRSNGNPMEAIESLNKITSKFSTHSRAPEAQYLKAEILYRDLQDFSKSIFEPGSVLLTKNCTRDTWFQNFEIFEFFENPVFRYFSTF